MDQLEIGFYSAVAAYGVIVTWTVIVRLRWLPVALVRFVYRLLNRLGRIPVLGGAVIACRRYPLVLAWCWPLWLDSRCRIWCFLSFGASICCRLLLRSSSAGLPWADLKTLMPQTSPTLMGCTRGKSMAMD